MEKMIQIFNQDALDYCSTQADNCQLMYGTYDIPDNK